MAEGGTDPFQEDPFTVQDGNGDGDDDDDGGGISFTQQEQDEIQNWKPQDKPRFSPSTPFNKGNDIEMGARMKTSHRETGEYSFAETSFTMSPEEKDDALRDWLNDIRSDNTGVVNISEAKKRGLILDYSQRRIQMDSAKNYIRRFFPSSSQDEAERLDLGFYGEDKNQIIFRTKKGALVKVFRDDGTGLLKDFTKRAEVRNILGKPINEMISERIKKEKNWPKKGGYNSVGYEDHVQETERLQREFDMLVSRKDLNETITEQEKQNQKNRDILQDPNSSESEKKNAQFDLQRGEDRISVARNVLDQRDQEKPLAERVREIFKKYGVTVASVLLAAGVTIGVVVSTVTNALKATGKALGKGLKDIGSKLGSLLPGLIGAVASFLFRTAGQAIGFLAKHSWLLILAVVAFLFENMKKQK